MVKHINNYTETQKNVEQKSIKIIDISFEYIMISIEMKIQHPPQQGGPLTSTYIDNDSF